MACLLQGEAIAKIEICAILICFSMVALIGWQRRSEELDEEDEDASEPTEHQD